MPLARAFWRDGVVCSHCAGPYPMECVVVSCIRGSDAPHALLRVHDREPQQVHLLRTDQPDLYPATELVAVAPAISADEMLAILDAQLDALKAAQHAVKAGKPVDEVRGTLVASISDYTRAVGLGVAPASIAIFCEPTGSILVQDTLTRISDPTTPPNELLMLLSGQHLALIGVFRNGGAQLHKKALLAPLGDSITSAIRCAYASMVSADIQCMSETISSDFPISLPSAFPVQLSGPLSIIELPCAWLLVFETNGQTVCYVAVTTDIRCKLLLRVKTDTSCVNMAVAVSHAHYLCQVACDKPFSGVVRSVKASFMHTKNDNILLLPYIS